MSINNLDFVKGDLPSECMNFVSFAKEYDAVITFTYEEFTDSFMYMFYYKQTGMRWNMKLANSEVVELELRNMLESMICERAFVEMPNLR